MQAEESYILPLRPKTDKEDSETMVHRIFVFLSSLGAVQMKARLPQSVPYLDAGGTQ